MDESVYQDRIVNNIWGCSAWRQAASSLEAESEAAVRWAYTVHNSPLSAQIVTPSDSEETIFATSSPSPPGPPGSSSSLPVLSCHSSYQQHSQGEEGRGGERRGEVDCNKCAEAGWPGPRSMLRPQSLSQRGLMVVATNTRLAASTCPALIQWNICWNKSSHDNENLNLLGWTPATREASSSTPSQTGLWTIFIPRTSLFRHLTDCGGRNKQKNILLKNTEKQWDISQVWNVSHPYSCWWHQARSHERAKSPLSFFTISLTLANMTRSVQNGPVCDW